MSSEEQEVLAKVAEPGADIQETTVRVGPDPRIGTRILDNYQILSMIAEGGMGTVYRAKHIVLQTEFAVKFLKEQVASEETFLRFKQEAETLQKLEHKNIVGFKDFGTANGTAFMIVDFLEGPSLAELIGKEKKLSIERTISIFLQVCDAVSYAHSQSIIHRDLKPSNIMLSKSGAQELVKVLDFGIAKITDPGQDKQLTRTGETFGSPLYMSPEQCLAQKLDERSDIYSIGCVIYECLTGRPPLEGENIYDTIYRQMNDLPAGLEEISSKRVREALESVIFRAIAKRPADRYRTVAELRNDLELIGAHSHRSLAGVLVGRFRLALLKLSPDKRAKVMRRLSAAGTVLFIASLGSALLFCRLYWEAGAKLEQQRIVPLRLYTDTVSRQDDNDTAAETIMRSVAKVTVLKNTINKLPANDVQRIKPLFKLAVLVRDDWNNYEESSRYLQQAYDIVESNPEFKATYRGQMSLGIVCMLLGDGYYYMHDFKKAEPFLARAIRIADETVNTRSAGEVGELYFKLGDCQLQLEKFQEASNNFGTAISCWTKVDNPLPERGGEHDSRAAKDRECLALLKRGEALRQLGKFLPSDHEPGAIEVLEEARAISLELRGENSNETAAAVGLLGLVYRDLADKSAKPDQSDFEKANQLLLQSEKIIDNSPDPDDHILHFLLVQHSQMLEQKGRFFEALPIRMRYGSLKPKDKRLRDKFHGSRSAQK